MSLWHRREYAADLPRGLPGSSCIPPQEFSRSPERMTRIRATPGPDPPGSSRCRFERRKTPVPRVLLSIMLAGPAPSGGTATSRLCQGRFPPSPAPPGSGCPQLQQPCCDRALAKVSHLHSNQQRLTAQTRSPTEPNYVTRNPPHLGNFVIAHIAGPCTPGLGVACRCFGP